MAIQGKDGRGKRYAIGFEVATAALRVGGQIASTADMRRSI